MRRWTRRLPALMLFGGLLAAAVASGQGQAPDDCVGKVRENLLRSGIYPLRITDPKPRPFEARAKELCNLGLTSFDAAARSSRATLGICGQVRGWMEGCYPSILPGKPPGLRPAPAEADYDQADSIWEGYCGALVAARPALQAHYAAFVGEINRRQWYIGSSSPTPSDKKLLEDIGGRLALDMRPKDLETLKSWRGKLDADTKELQTFIDRVVATRGVSQKLGNKYQRLSPQQVQAMAGWLKENPGRLAGGAQSGPGPVDAVTGATPSSPDRQRQAIETAKREFLSEQKKRSEIMRAIQNQKTIDQIPKKDGVYEYWEIATTPEEFLNFFNAKKELTYEKRSMVFNKLPNDIVPFEEIRYVPDPKTGKLIDMRHFLVVGSLRKGTSYAGGRLVEVLQGFQSVVSLQLSKEDRAGLAHSSFHPQDLFSNDLGAEFFQDPRYAEGNGKTLLENLRQFFIDRGAQLP